MESVFRAMRGYPYTNFNRKPYQVQRLFYHCHYPDEYDLDDKTKDIRILCANKLCVNLNHLRVGDRDYRYHDSIYHPLGERYPYHLSIKEAYQAIIMRFEQDYTIPEIADCFDINEQQIYKMFYNRRMLHKPVLKMYNEGCSYKEIRRHIMKGYVYE